MTFIAKEPESATMQPLDEGVYVGTCYLIADIGEQYNQLSDSWRPNLMIGWEINGETYTVDGVEHPKTISNFYANSLHEKAKLRKDLECWRGKKFTPDELQGFDVSSMLNTGCQLQIAHKTKADGSVRAYINAIMALPKATKIDKATQTIVYDIDTATDEELEKMPKIVQIMVEKSRQYQFKQQQKEYANKPFSGDGGNDEDGVF